jgi:hypothetical protein
LKDYRLKGDCVQTAHALGGGKEVLRKIRSTSPGNRSKPEEKNPFLRDRQFGRKQCL